MCFRWTVKIKKGGGISFNAVVKLTHMNEKLVDLILREYSKPSCFFFFVFSSSSSMLTWVRLILEIFNAEVLIREDCTPGKASAAPP